MKFCGNCNHATKLKSMPNHIHCDVIDCIVAKEFPCVVEYFANNRLDTDGRLKKNRKNIKKPLDTSK